MIRSFIAALLLLTALPGWAQTFGGNPAPSAVGPTGVSVQTVQTKGLVSTALATPVNGTFAATTGTLNNGSYCYRVVARNAAGGTAPSTETCLTVSGGASSNGVIVTWGAVAGTTLYDVYCRVTAIEQLCVAGLTGTTWTDTGAVSPSGVLPLADTSATISTTEGATVDHVTTTAPSGQVGLQGVTSQTWCMGTGGTGCLSFDGSYAYYPPASSFFANTQVVTPSINSNSGSLDIRGGGTDNAAMVAVLFHSYPDSTVAGGRMAGFAPDNAGTIKVSLYNDGALWLFPHPVGTCGDATNPEGKEVNVPGSTTHATKKCLCTYVPTGTTYAWKNVSATFLTDTAAFGNTTTCPDP